MSCNCHVQYLWTSQTESLIDELTGSWILLCVYATATTYIALLLLYILQVGSTILIPLILKCLQSLIQALINCFTDYIIK